MDCGELQRPQKSINFSNSCDVLKLYSWCNFVNYANIYDDDHHHHHHHHHPHPHYNQNHPEHLHQQTHKLMIFAGVFWGQENQIIFPKFCCSDPVHTCAALRAPTPPVHTDLTNDPNCIIKSTFTIHKSQFEKFLLVIITNMI